MKRWNPNLLQRAQSKVWAPQTGVEENQGAPVMMPGELRDLQVPRNAGNHPGFINPYALNHYGPVTIPIAAPGIMILQSNERRCYLLIQNQGPGNVWFGFGRSVSVAGDGYLLLAKQAYEQIGGGFMTAQGRSIPQSFVAPDYIMAISDDATTLMCVGEGIARFPVG